MPLSAEMRMPGNRSETARLCGRLILIAYSEWNQPGQGQAADVSGQQKGHAMAEDLEDGLILLAIVGISDPLRAEVVTAVQQCNRAGITVRMLTGQSWPPPKSTCHCLLHMMPSGWQICHCWPYTSCIFFSWVGCNLCLLRPFPAHGCLLPSITMASTSCAIIQCWDWLHTPAHYLAQTPP